MGDGWETKRSRHKGHKDWVIIKLQVTENLSIEIELIRDCLGAQQVI
jgi:allantoicase